MHRDDPRRTPAGDEFLTVPEAQTKFVRYFPTAQALKWFLRKNRQDLLKAEALLQINGRTYIDPQRFGAALGEIGAKRAQQRAAA